MDVAALHIPPGMQGYAVADLERFLEAAAERARVIEDAIAEARAKRDAAAAGPTSALEVRRSIAAEWSAAQRDADAIRAAADAEALAIIEGAETAIRSLLEPAPLDDRTHDGSPGAVLDPASAAPPSELR